MDVARVRRVRPSREVGNTIGNGPGTQDEASIANRPVSMRRGQWRLARPGSGSTARARNLAKVPEEARGDGDRIMQSEDDLATAQRMLSDIEVEGAISVQITARYRVGWLKSRPTWVRSFPLPSPSSR